MRSKLSQAHSTVLEKLGQTLQTKILSTPTIGPMRLGNDSFLRLVQHHNVTPTMHLGSPDLNLQIGMVHSKGDYLNLNSSIIRVMTSSHHFTLQYTTFKVSDENHFINLKNKIEKVKWDVIGINKL